jgi:energy-coupling factor transporter ATP-binding protein EcfA2
MNQIELLEQYKPLFIDPPPTRYFLVTGSRGSGKSYTVNLFLLNLTYEEGHVILFTRYTLVSAFISIIPEFIDKIELLGKQEDFEVTQSEIINKRTGSKILFRGIKTSSGVNTANLKSIAGVTTFVLEEAEELVDEDIFDRIDLSVRDVNKPNRVMLIMNPSFKSHWVYKRFVKNPDSKYCTYIHTTYLHNKQNLSQSFIEQAKRTRKENQHRYEHLFLGKWLDDAEGMLWNRPIIERSRMPTAPELQRIVVAIDPAATANMESDETGIIVCGKDKAGYGYVLEDLSGKYSPSQWGNIAVKARERWNADCIVAEKNQGGDMVESVIRSAGEKQRIKLVTATKGKFVRAEPIYSLYEQGKIFHIGHFPLLESQMITFDPDKGKSPDRVDALVWAFTELMLGSTFNFSI